MSRKRIFTLVFFIFCSIRVTLSAVRNETIVFTSSKEVFVGEDAILEWKLNKNLVKNIAQIKFGVITRPATHGERLDAILVKKFPKEFPKGRVFWNSPAPKHVANFVRRTSVFTNKTAAFKISKVSLNDSSEFYCTVEKVGSSQNMITDYIKIRVLDVEILNETSSQDVISWTGHKVHLRCKARVVPNTNTSFIWRNKARGNMVVNRTKHRDTKTSSTLKIRTHYDADFGPYECVAITPSTHYSHEIRIKRLYEPSAPNNFSHHRKLTDNENCSVVSRLTWMPPLHDGGAPVISYSVEYKPFGSQWYKANSRHVYNNYIDICRPPRDRGGDGLFVRVRAWNKVGKGVPSPTTVVTFWDEPTAPQELKTQLIRNRGEAFIKLTWGYPLDDGGVKVSAYQIEYKPMGSTWSVAARSEETLENVQETSLWKTSKNVYLYDVRIRAINGVGFGEWSNIIRAAFADVPSRPLNIADKLIPHARPTLPHIHIQWNRPVDNGGLPIRQYRLEYKAVSKKNWALAKHVFVKDEKYVIKHVEKDQEYDVRVAAENDMGTGDWSGIITVMSREKAFVSFKVSSKGTQKSANIWQIGLLNAVVGLTLMYYFTL